MTQTARDNHQPVVIRSGARFCLVCGSGTTFDPRTGLPVHKTGGRISAK